MAEVHHFAYGWITPIMAYSLSVLGSLLGLICASRARRLATARERIPWLVMAAVAIGGTGIWVMHFMAMIGFQVTGTEIRYDLAVTALSVVVAVVVVGLGLFIVGLGRPSALKILGGGVLTGLGVNSMHYIGMAAMRLDGEISYDPVRVIASIGIAVVAATVALWLSVTVNTGAMIFGSAMVMGVAVTGMHYTGMSAMSVELSENGAVSGASSTTLIGPIALAVVLVVMGLVYSVLAAPTDEDRAGAAFIEARMSGQTGSAAMGIWSAPDPGEGSVASRFAPRGGGGAGGSAASGGRGAGGQPPAGGPAGGGFASGGSGADGFASGPAEGGFASGGPAAGGSAARGPGGFASSEAERSRPGLPGPQEPASTGLGASLRETEAYVEEHPTSRWAGLTEPVRPVARPVEPPAQLPRRPGSDQPPQRNTRDPWVPPRTPTHHD